MKNHIYMNIHKTAPEDWKICQKPPPSLSGYYLEYKGNSEIWVKFNTIENSYYIGIDACEYFRILEMRQFEPITQKLPPALMYHFLKNKVKGI